MKLKKVMLMAALAAAIGSVNMVTALADENETETKYGWEGSGNTWRYYDSNGNLKSGWIKAEDGDGRGNDVWYYIDPSTNLMIYNTCIIDHKVCGRIDIIPHIISASITIFSLDPAAL